MDAFRCVVAVLLFTTFPGAEQRPIIDDTAEYFDVFPGGQSTEEFPMNESTSDGIAASYKSAGMFHQPVDAPDCFQQCNGSLPTPGCNATSSTSEEIVSFQHTTRRPTNITLQPKATDMVTNLTVGAYVLLAVVAVMAMPLFLMLWVKIFNAAVNRDPQIRQAFYAMVRMRGPVFV